MREKKERRTVRTVSLILLFTVIYAAVIIFILAEMYAIYPVYIGAGIILYLAEFFTARKAGIKSGWLSLSVFTVAILFFLIFLDDPLTNTPIFKDVLSFCILRAFLLTFDFIADKKKKLIPSAAALTVLFLLAIPFSEKFFKEYTEYIVGTPDRTSSWNSINQQVERDESWKRIVTDSSFELGELKKSIELQGEYVCSLGSYPLIDGSTVCVPMAVEFARQHLSFNDEQARSFVNFSTTHYAYENLINKDGNYSMTLCVTGGEENFLVNTYIPDIVIGTEPSDEELAMAKENSVELIKEPVCYDAFVFITHKDNPVENLTVQQIRDIYTGKIKNWKEVGGKNEKITAYQREKNSGSQTAMENLVMGTADMIDPIKVKVIEGMGELVDAVAEYENETASLGYTYRYYIDTLYKNDEIKTISVNGVEPDDGNIRSGKYPFTTNYYAVIRKGEETEKGGRFLEWMLSDEGQSCIRQAGYITLE